MSESYILTLINYSRVPFIHLDMQPLCWISCTLLETKIIPALLSWSISCILELTIQVNFLYIICKISLNSFCKTTFKFFLSLFVLKVCVIMRSINYLSSFYHILKCLTSSVAYHTMLELMIVLQLFYGFPSFRSGVFHWKILSNYFTVRINKPFINYFFKK